jgi:hypothetical protein
MEDKTGVYQVNENKPIKPFDIYVDEDSKIKLVLV